MADGDIELVEDDITRGFSVYLSGGEFSPEHDLPRLIERGEVEEGEPAARVVPWRFEGRHTRSFRGLAPTDNLVVIHGVTVLTGDDPPLLRRYIDWLDVYTQLGMTLSGRPVSVEA